VKCATEDKSLSRAGGTGAKRTVEKLLNK